MTASKLIRFYMEATSTASTTSYDRGSGTGDEGNDDCCLLSEYVSNSSHEIMSGIKGLIS